MADRSLYSRLRKLFSQNVVVRNVGGKKLKVADTDNVQTFMSNAMRDRYSRIHSGTGYASNYGSQYGTNMAYQAQRIMLFRDYDVMDNDPIIACITGDTRVMTLEGPKSIRELTESYTGEPFEVWSWDTTTCKYVIGQAHHPRKTGVGRIVEVQLDNGAVFRCTDNHRVMLIDGTYKEAGTLLPNDRLMPFEYKNKEYMQVRIPNGRYIPAHRYVCEHVLGMDLPKGINVHHINHKKYDNRTANLEVLTVQDHLQLHGLSDITNRQRSVASSQLWKDATYRVNALKGLREWQKSEEGQKFMSQHISHLNKLRWKTDLDYATKMAQIFSHHAQSLWSNPEWKMWKRAHHSMTMKLKYANDPSYRERTKRKGSDNGMYDNSITNEWILANGTQYESLSEFARHPHFESRKLAHHHVCQFIRRRLKEASYNSWKEYKDAYSYANHAVTHVTFTNVEEDVYDLTVDGFENFAIEQGIIISNSALDIYADESTVKNEYGDILTIESSNGHIKEVLHNLFYDIMNIEFNLWPWTRNLVKYGDFFLFLEISPEYGIVNVMPLSHYDTIRVEGENPQNPYYVYFETLGQNGTKQKFDNYEIAHFRLLSDTNFLPYGKSMIESARRVFRQLVLMEDAMMIHRIMRAPEKRVFKIDIGNIPPQEVDNFIQKLIDRTKKVPFIDSSTGDYNLRYNMQNILEDFYLPVRGGDSGTAIESLPGLEFNPIDDIEYLKHKMMAALKVPKAFLGYEENVNGKATLAAEDVRFARTIERIQRIMISELTKIAIVHLYAQGFTDEQLVDFSLSLTNPSTIYEQEKINLWIQKSTLVTQLQATKMLSSDWIYQNVFGMPEAEYEDERNKMLDDTKRMFRLTQIEQGQSDPKKFGFPQDMAPQEGSTGENDAMGGMSGGSAKPNIPPGSAPSTGGQGAPKTPIPQSIDDLPTAEELGIEEDVEEEDERGQPRKPPQYGQDSHVRGRDPLGFKERYKALQVGQKRRPNKNYSPLSVEVKQSLNTYSSRHVKPQVLTEQDDPDAGTFLDERNLLEKSDDTD